MPKYVVRCGSMRTLGVFSHKGEPLRRGSSVIARTDRGLELGEVLCEATEEALKHMQSPARGQVLRAATVEDQHELMRMRSLTRAEFEKCKALIAELALPMDLVDVEHLFGGERIVFYYLAENRVDFRELVKRLAAEFQTRIEMRQIGVRDEAKLLADYGDCGKPVCCNTHLNEMPPVSMKMAKLQRATLDPTKISGRCGRLKCCLRYEYDTYLDLQKELPPVGCTVLTRTGRMRVLGHEIIASQLLVETEDHRRMLVPASEVLTVINAPARKGGGRRDDEGEAGEGGEGAEKTADRPERSERPERDRGPGEARSEGGRSEQPAQGRQGDRGGDRGQRGDRPPRGKGPREGRGGEPRRDGGENHPPAAEQRPSEPSSAPPSSSSPPDAPSPGEAPPRSEAPPDAPPTAPPEPPPAAPLPPEAG